MRKETQAYGNVAKQISSPRELEATLLLQATSRLQAVQDKWMGKCADLDDALLYNRRLWTIFLDSVTNTDNPLPAEIRQNVANLGVFVINQTMTMTMAVNPRPEHLGSLININREVAAGLLGRA
jgi:flagellar protein FlaF